MENKVKVHIIIENGHSVFFEKHEEDFNVILEKALNNGDQFITINGNIYNKNHIKYIEFNGTITRYGI